MGGKKRGSLRQKRRADVAAHQLSLATTTAGRVVENKDDGELFVIDDVGNVPLQKRLQSEVRKKRERKEALPEQLERKVRKMLKKHDGDKVSDMAKEGRRNLDIKELKRRRSRKQNKTNGAFDLWDADGDDNGTAGKSRVVPVTRGVPPSMGGTAPVILKAQSKESRTHPNAVPTNRLRKERSMAKKKARPTVAVEVALPGQSYRPDREQHQDAVGEALAIELQRKEAEDYKTKPLSGDNHDELNNNGSDSSDSEDDMDTANSNTPTVPKKRPEKLTKAQRNRQKRAQAQTREAQARKKQRLALHDVTEVRKLTKVISRHERTCEEKRKVVSQQKEETRNIPLGTDLYKTTDPLHVPALPVALTEDLNNNGTLRTIKPKGSIMLERLQSLTQRNMANKKSLYKKKNVVQGKKRKTMIKGGNCGHDDFF